MARGAECRTYLGSVSFFLLKILNWEQQKLTHFKMFSIKLRKLNSYDHHNKTSHLKRQILWLFRYMLLIEFHLLHKRARGRMDKLEYGRICESVNQWMNQSTNLNKANNQKESLNYTKQILVRSSYLSIWDLAVDGSPISKTLMSLKRKPKAFKEASNQARGGKVIRRGGGVRRWWEDRQGRRMAGGWVDGQGERKRGGER